MSNYGFDPRNGKFSQSTEFQPQQLYRTLQQDNRGVEDLGEGNELVTLEIKEVPVDEIMGEAGFTSPELSNESKQVMMHDIGISQEFNPHLQFGTQSFDGSFNQIKHRRDSLDGSYELADISTTMVEAPHDTQQAHQTIEQTQPQQQHSDEHPFFKKWAGLKPPKRPNDAPNNPEEKFHPSIVEDGNLESKDKCAEDNEALLAQIQELKDENHDQTIQIKKLKLTLQARPPNQPGNENSNDGPSEEEAKLREQVQELESQIERLRNSYENMDKNVGSKDSEITELKEQISKTQSHCEQGEQEINRLRSEIEQHKQYAEGKMRELDEEASYHRKNCEELNQELFKCRDELQNEQNRHQSYSGESDQRLHEMETIVNAARGEIRRLEAVEQQLKDMGAQQNLDLSRCKSERDSYKRNINELSNEYRKLQQKTIHFKSEADHRTSLYNQLQQKMDSLRNQINQLTSENARLRADAESGLGRSRDWDFGGLNSTEGLNFGDMRRNFRSDSFGEAKRSSGNDMMLADIPMRPQAMSPPRLPNRSDQGPPSSVNPNRFQQQPPSSVQHHRQQQPERSQMDSRPPHHHHQQQQQDQQQLGRPNTARSSAPFATGSGEVNADLGQLDHQMQRLNRTKNEIQSELNRLGPNALRMVANRKRKTELENQLTRVEQSLLKVRRSIRTATK
eukprot:TRINITY_DN777943_c0_g1_i1.p1 TRINITY_DN777943_c0_g1~~TRINITY_DN777943_c0_g1_i1.p1  ORF type:complete len:679 (+),score=222.65 TRINITY_DN777943_c0_g1_i1:69-2105(+)